MNDAVSKDIESRFSQLEQRVAELYDRVQIEQLVTRYAHAVCEENVELVLSLFVDEQAAVDFDRSAVPDGGVRMGAGRREYQVAWIGIYRDVYEKVGSAWKFKSRAASVKHTPMLENQR